MPVTHDHFFLNCGSPDDGLHSQHFGLQQRAVIVMIPRTMSDAPDGFEKTTAPLPAIHGWKCKEGNSLFVADRGAVAFEIPQRWVVHHDQKGTLTFHDKEPPDDQARLSLSIFHLPPVQGGWKKLPLEELYRAVAKQESEEQKQQLKTFEIHHEPRAEMELIWSEKGIWSDPENGKPIRCRQILALRAWFNR